MGLASAPPRASVFSWRTPWMVLTRLCSVSSSDRLSASKIWIFSSWSSNSSMVKFSILTGTIYLRFWMATPSSFGTHSDRSALEESTSKKISHRLMALMISRVYFPPTVIPARSGRYRRSPLQFLLAISCRAPLKSGTFRVTIGRPQKMTLRLWERSCLS